MQLCDHSYAAGLHFDLAWNLLCVHYTTRQGFKVAALLTILATQGQATIVIKIEVWI